MSAPQPGSPRTVFCQKLQKTLPGLDAAPWPGALGQRIYEHISAEAWHMKLVGFRNRVLVFIQWASSYFTYQRSVRLITGPYQERTVEKEEGQGATQARARGPEGEGQKDSRAPASEGVSV